MSSRTTMESPVPRRDLIPHQLFLKEKNWLESTQFPTPEGVPNPAGICESKFQLYQAIIWNNSPDTIIENYGCTVADMAILCGNDKEGRLLSSHIEFLLKQVDKKCQDCACICLPSVSPSPFEENFKEREFITRLIFVINVGKNMDGTVFIASVQNPGDHWVLVIAEIATNTVLYCDTLAWDVPSLLLESLSYYTQKLNLPSLSQTQLIQMHAPSASGSRHHCTIACMNYPLESYANASGVISITMGAVAALDYDYFRIFMESYSTDNKIFLHNPGKYDSYLRRILISWFMQEDVDISALCMRNIELGAEKIVNHTDSDDRASMERRVSDSVPSEAVPEKKPSLMEAVLHREKSSPGGKKTYQCPHCECVLSHRQSLFRHKQRYHKSQIKKSEPTHYSYCALCSDFKTALIQDLISHYCHSHNQAIEISTKAFLSIGEFHKWKKEIEKESSSLFTRRSGARKFCSSGVKTSYLYCRRSGHSKPVENRKKSLKTNGSCKIGNKCTAYMIERINEINGSVTVEYCLQHNGHSFEPQHHVISDDIRFKVAEKLCQGVEVSKILQDVKEGITDDHIRDSLLTRKDILNIKNQFKIFSKQKHRDDWQSVHLWVQDLEKQAPNPIIFYKAQNTPQEDLGEQDFLLCIQTDFQRSVLLEQKARIICVDSSQKATRNDFFLTTVLVLDEFDEGIPVAWAISNREDSQILRQFFIAMKNSCEKEIESDTFMGDLADNSYTAWCQVFPSPSKKLYCSWHVDKQWRQKVKSTIHTESDQYTMYMLLKELLRETDKTKFTEMLKNFVAYLNENAPSLADYFSKNFVENDKFFLWAGCFRKGSLSSTNMFVEPFHRVLKDIYLNKMQNKRVDSLLVVLLKLGRDKALDEMTRLQNERVRHQIRKMREEQKATTQVTRSRTVRSSPYNTRRKSRLKSNTNINTPQKKVCACKLVCDMCCLCIHRCSCSRHDLLCKSVSSKHSHAIQKSDSGPSNAGREELMSSESYCGDGERNSALPDTGQSIENMRAAFVQEMSLLLDLGLQCKNVDCLEMMHSRVREIKNLASGKI